MMEEILAPCGDRCDACPRYTAKTPEALRATAELWYRMGWRGTILPPEEMRCSGCSGEKACEYGIVQCLRDKNLPKCSQCPDFPCGRISDMLETTRRSEKRCREVCSAEEYAMLDVAFFQKEANLRK
jgi:hypothetical protein